MQKNLVVIRHGQSEWNLKNLFTGWADVDLTDQGISEAQNAGKIISSLDFEIDIAFTSELKRAQNTLKVIQNHLGNFERDVIRDWRVNERTYGALQGLNKSENAAKTGEETVQISDAVRHWQLIYK